MADATKPRSRRRADGIGVVAILLLAVGAVYLLVWIVEGVLALEKEVAVAIVAGFATVVGSVVTVVLTNRANKLRELAEAHRPEKMKVYDAYIRFWVDMMKRTKQGTSLDMTSRKAVDEWFEIKKGMIGWASPKSILAATRLEGQAAKDPKGAVLRFDDVLRAIREDLGVSNMGLQSGDLFNVLLKPDDRSDIGASS